MTNEYKERKMRNNINWGKLARYFADELPSDERREIKQTLQSDPELHNFVESLKSIRSLARNRGEKFNIHAEWTELAERTGIAEKNAKSENQLHRIQSYTDIRQSHRLPSSFGMLLRAAAVILLIIGIAFLSYRLGYEQNDTDDTSRQLAMREVSTQRGQRANLRFNDGTKVSLNAASTLRFPEKFSGGTREVYLEGEAYFDVVNQDHSQFIVHAGAATIRVLGTQFNVRAWADDEQIEVVVAEGKVEFRGDSDESVEGIVLISGQLSTMLRDGSITDPKPVSLGEYLAWLDGKLIFDRTPVSYALKQLGRKHNMDFVVNEPSLYNRRITATFSDESIDEVLRALSISLNARYKIDGRRVELIIDE
jgi:transmembrane sensor